MIQSPKREVDTMETVLTVEETSEALKVSTAVVRALLRSGELKGRKVGRDWRVLESDLHEFMRGGDK